MTPRSSGRPPALRLVATFLLLGVAGLLPAAAAESAARKFDLPSAVAETSLRQFALQSGAEVLFATRTVGPIRTNEVRGDLTPREAIARLLADTGLRAEQDASTGAWTISSDPNAQRAAPSVTSDRPGNLRPSDAAGEIRGQVSNGMTGANLEKVRIRVRETGRDYFTERGGTFAIGSLPPGTYTLSFEYPGLDVKTEVVTVDGRQVVSLPVTLGSDVYVMTTLVVASQREGNAAAIAEQRFAPNVTNIITADAFGDITKANVGNLLRRMPGVTGITDDEIDTSVIQVRGMAANLTSIDVDGTRAASAMNGSRKQNVNAIPVDMIEKVEVTKAPTAADDADSLGGRVKLTTKSAFDIKDRLLNLRMGVSYNDTYGKTVTRDREDYIPPSFGVTYSNVVGLGGNPRSLGVFATGNYDKFLDARSLVNFGHVTPTGGSPGATTTKDYSTYDFASDELHEQERMGGSIRLEYKLPKHTTIGISTTVSRYVDDFDRARQGFNGASINLALSDPDPNYTVVNNAAYTSQRNLRESETDTYNVRVFGTTALTGLKLTYDINTQGAEKFEFRNQTQFISRNLFSYSLDWRPNPEYPMPQILSGSNPWADRFTNVNSTSLEVRRQSVDKEIWGGRMDAEKSFEWKLPTKLQAGFRYREEIQEEDQDRFVASMPLATLGRDLSSFLDEGWKNSGGNGEYPLGSVPSNQKVLGNVSYIGGGDPRNAWNYDPALITMNPTSTVQNSLLNDSRLREVLYAAYLQGNTKLGRLGVTGGVRYERTEVKTRYAVRDRSTTDLLAQFSGQETATATYDDVFPSLHLRYNILDSLVVRASFSTTIGRPDLNVVTGSADYNLATRTMSVPNAELAPQRSKNYDLSLEYYFKPVGVISVGVFEKNIEDYIAQVSRTISEAEAADLGAPIDNPSPTGPSWTLNSQENSGDARVRGLELNYTQQFSFLPGAFRGLGVFANSTWLESTGTQQVVGGAPTVTPLINFIPRSSNVGLSYNYGRWDVQLQRNYHSTFLDGVNTTNPQLRNSYRGAKEQWDLNGRYKLTRALTIFANLSNFTSQGEPDYDGWEAPERRGSTISYSFIITGGISVKF